ncbi:unnamed protein product [Urochloa decumbens]|uniref:Uncharacterized protein n=1 Tax=Urochloa decumbens TaxID=240449 RepID=A0ABC9C1F3_9POAL
MLGACSPTTQRHTTQPMDVPFFVAFSGILLLGRYLPFALPANARAFLAADSAAAPPARAAKYAISVAVAGLVLLVSSMHQCSSSGSGSGGGGTPPQCPAEAAMEPRALCLNSAAMFFGTLLLGAGSVVAASRAPPVVGVAVEHLTGVTETIAITAFAHDLCIFLKAN